MYQMVFKQLSDTQAIIHLSWIKKGFIVLITLFLLAVTFSSPPKILWVAGVLAIISFSALLYRESWLFDRDHDDPDHLTLTSFIGIWPLHRKRVYVMSKVTSIKVHTPRTHLQKHLAGEARSWGYHRLAHSFDKSISKLEIHARDEKTITLYAETTKKVQALISLADQIATFLNVQREILEQ